MKKFFILSLVFLLAGCIHALSVELEIKYDRFKKQTVVSTKPYNIPLSKICFSLLATFQGETPIKPPETILVGFDSKNNSWRFLTCNTTDLLLDNESLSLGEGKHRGDVLSSGGVFESIFYFISFDILKKISEAKQIEGKICNTEFILTPKEHQDIKDFINIFSFNNN